jgi:manganese transport protein
VVFFISLLSYIIIYPLLSSSSKKKITDLHGESIELDWTHTEPVKRIAIAVDFSISDQKLIKTAIAHAMRQVAGEKVNEAEFIFIHVVESVAANYLLEASDDEESRKDKERLDNYTNALRDKGYNAISVIGYQNRVKEIVRIVKEKDAQLLVMGAHKHKGWKDYFFGETIEAVRHSVSIPVLIVND